MSGTSGVAETNIASPVTHDRVVRYAGYLLNAYGSYKAARDQATTMRRDALTFEGNAAKQVAGLWELVYIELTDMEERAHADAIAEAY